jgi:hypothetical protein
MTHNIMTTTTTTSRSAKIAPYDSNVYDADTLASSAAELTCYYFDNSGRPATQLELLDHKIGSRVNLARIAPTHLIPTPPNAPFDGKKLVELMRKKVIPILEEAEYLFIPADSEISRDPSGKPSGQPKLFPEKYIKDTADVLGYEVKDFKESVVSGSYWPRVDASFSKDAPYDAVTPKFVPNYTRVALDDAVLNKLSTLRALVPAEYKDAAALWSKDLESFANNHYFGAGTMQGQLNRLSLVYDLVDRLEVDMYHTEGLYSWKELDALWPLHPNKHLIKLSGNPSQILKLAKDSNLILTSTGAGNHSEAGLLFAPQYGQVARSDTVAQEIVYADAICGYMRATYSKRHGMEEIQNALSYLKLVKMKPKPEVYERAAILEKTRSIFVVSSPVQLINQIPLRLPHDHEGKLPLGLNLLGWSVFHGGMDAVYRRILQKGFSVFIYADNLYLIFTCDGHTYWASLDGEKMECCHTYQDVGQFAQRLVNWWGDDLDPFWSFVLMDFFRWSSICCTGLLGVQQMEIPGMATGCVGTAYINHWKTLVFYKAWVDAAKGVPLHLERSGEGWKFPAVAIDAMKRAGVNYKMEVVTDVTDLKVGSHYKLDLLGYDLYVKQGDLIAEPYGFPVLNKDRLMSSLLFQKRKYDTGEGKRLSRESGTMIRFMRFKALYLIGGWAHPVLAEAIRAQCHALRKDLTDVSFEVTELTDLLNLPESDVVELLAKLTDYVVPTLGDIYGLNEATMTITPELVRAFTEPDALPALLLEKGMSFDDMIDRFDPGGKEDWAKLVEEARPSEWKQPVARELERHTRQTREPTTNPAVTKYTKKKLKTVAKDDKIVSLTKKLSKALKKERSKQESTWFVVGTKNNEEPPQDPRVRGAAAMRMYLADLAAGFGITIDQMISNHNQMGMGLQKTYPEVNLEKSESYTTDDKLIIAAARKELAEWTAKKEKQKEKLKQFLKL